MPDIDASAAFAATLAQDEKTAQLIERTALAIFIGTVQNVPVTSAEETAWAHLWASSDPGTRIRCRCQARAALAASKLLERVADLEERIAAAQRELVIYAGELNAQDLAAKVRRVDRVLAKPRPEPEPISIK
jgi:hypothetical protein